ncbi:hypothetical protein PENTCL1PPCAC_501, partial [Pristionchus entomophagus]
DLRERIKLLEIENRDIKYKLSTLETNANTGEHLCLQNHMFCHEYKIELHPDLSLTEQSEPQIFDGVEINVRIERNYMKDMKEKTDNLSSFFVSLILQNTEIDRNTSKIHCKQKFVMTTTEVMLKPVQRGHSKTPIESRSLAHPRSQNFVLSSHSEKQIGDRIPFSFDETGRGDKTFYIYVTAAVQSMDPIEFDDTANTIVVVKKKEFPVSAQYLSLWSQYFSAYFRADMKEKKEDRYPIKDEDISADDFEELLMVIYPTSKPISANNYFTLLRMARKFDTPELTRRIECFLIDFERNGLERARVFRIATDQFQLKLVQANLMHRWQNPTLLKMELMMSEEYQKLTPETKSVINERFAQACIGDSGFVPGTNNERSYAPPEQRRESSITNRRSNSSMDQTHSMHRTADTITTYGFLAHNCETCCLSSIYLLVESKLRIVLRNSFQ